MWRNGKPGILVVDDEPSVLMTYGLILEQEGYAVRTAETSTQAISELEGRTFDLILCDYSLEQEHTGFELIDRARQLHPKVATVLLTGYASAETVDEAKRKGIAVLFKPIDIQEFFQTVRTLMRNKNESQKGTQEGGAHTAEQRGEIGQGRGRTGSGSRPSSHS